MQTSKLLAALFLALAGVGPARADVHAVAKYTLSLGGTIVADADFRLDEKAGQYELALDAAVGGLAQLIASGTAKARSTGKAVGSGLVSDRFDLTTRASGEDFSIKVTYGNGAVSSFLVTPPLAETADRVSIERRHLARANDMLAAFVRRGAGLDKSLCNRRAEIFTGVERFDLIMSFARNDEATSPRTAYQGPVVLCNVKYRPISGHFTTSEFTKSLAEDQRILIWYAPLKDTGYFIPYRVLLTTSIGDLSMVLTGLN